MDMLLAWFISRFREVRGIYCRLKWLKVQIMKLLLAAASAYFTFMFITLTSQNYLTYFSDPSHYGVITESLAVMIVIFAAIQFSSTLTSSIAPDKLPFITEIEINDKINAEYKSYKISKHDDQAILYDPAVNIMLEFNSNPIEYDTNMFQVHPIIFEMLPIFIFKMPEAGISTSDDLKVRMNTDLVVDVLSSKAVVTLQKTSYFRDRLSNTLANYRFRKDNRLIFDLRSSEVLTAQKQFFNLRDSKLSNQLGGSVILLTSDSTILFLRQGNRTAENPGRLAPAGSGSFNPRKPIEFNALSFQEYARQETSRELIEECDLSSNDIHDIQICGFGRYLYRNGKPEIFCIASTKLSSKTIKIPIKEWDYQQREVEFHSFAYGLDKNNVLSGLKDLIHKIENRHHGYENTSGPLYWNVLFAIEYLEQLDEINTVRLLNVHGS